VTHQNVIHERHHFVQMLPVRKPSGLEVVQKHRWNVYSASGCHSCVELHSLVIISHCDIFNGKGDRQCKQAWPCSGSNQFWQQFVLGAGWLKIQHDSPRKFSSYGATAGPQIPYRLMLMEWGSVHETK